MTSPEPAGVPRRVPRGPGSDLPKYEPQMATLVASAPSGPEWVHEIKLDGYRMGCVIDAGGVRLISRNGCDWTQSFPEIVEAAAAVPAKQAVIDGEITVVLPGGRTSFQALQNAVSGAARRGLTYFAFDLLYLDGRDLRPLPLEARKRALRRLLEGTAIRYSEHLEAEGAAVFAQACRVGAEGIVSKRRNRPYRAARSKDWLKVRCTLRQEFVIGGFTDPQDSRRGTGALLVGYPEDGRLVFAGKVSTGRGYTPAFARELRARLEPLRSERCPFAPRPAGWLGTHAHWVRPELVAEVQFSEWTEGGKVRHPSLLGLRPDKAPNEVRRETPQEFAADAAAPKSQRTGARRARGGRAVRVAGVPISTPERVLYPTLNFSKLDLARLYADLADWILPHVALRPLTLVRCEHGASRADALRTQCQFLKHTSGWHLWVPDSVRRVHVREQKKIGEYLVIDSVQALLAILNGDILELHAWNAQVDRLEQPDRLVFDLDPGPDVPWPALVRSAQLVRSRLDAAGLRSWVKSTGGKGLHVVVPLEPVAGWDECFAFARSFAESAARAAPSSFTVAFGKSGRRGKVLIDYKRNHRAAASIVTFSSRARPNGTMSVPLRWRDLDPERPIEQVTVQNVRERIARWHADPWCDYWETQQRLPGGKPRKPRG